MGDGKKRGKWVVVLHHTVRPRTCLYRVLEALENATEERPFKIEVVVQGPSSDVPSLEGFLNDETIELVRVDNEENMGNGVPMSQAVDRFLKSDYRWFGRVDDDILVPPGALDILEQCIVRTVESGYMVNRATMATKNQRPRSIRVVSRQEAEPMLKLLTKRIETLTHDDVIYDVCDFTDIGCVLFDRAPLEEGCKPDPQFFVGCFSADWGWQAMQRGYKSILCVKPRVDHIASQCKSGQHEVARRGVAGIRKAAFAFRDKWGVEPFGLTKYKR